MNRYQSMSICIDRYRPTSIDIDRCRPTSHNIVQNDSFRQRRVKVCVLSRFSVFVVSVFFLVSKVFGHEPLALFAWLASQAFPSKWARLKGPGGWAQKDVAQIVLSTTLKMAQAKGSAVLTLKFDEPGAQGVLDLRSKLLTYGLLCSHG